MTRPYRAVSTQSTGQKQPILGEDQIENSAGGFVYEADIWTRLHRFLILGSEGGTYYIDEQALTLANAKDTLACIREDGLRAVREIVEISDSGRARKNDQAIFALAMASKLGDEATAHAAYMALPQVCRTGTHLFQYMNFVEQFGSSGGSGTKRALGRWYARDLKQVAYQAVKYRQREGWTHRDVLRVAHPEPRSEGHAALFQWLTKGGDDEAVKERFGEMIGEEMALPSGHALRMVEGYERAQHSPDPAYTVWLIDEYQLPREAIRTEHQNDPSVQFALLHNDMPIGALVRNLANMTRSGVLTAGSAGTSLVVEALADEERLRKSRLHPLSVLVALHTYALGRSFQGRGEPWTPVGRVVDALDKAFYTTFGNVEPTGKRLMLAIDVSGSMGAPLVGLQGIPALTGAAAMALVTAAVESNYEIVAFSAAGSWKSPHQGRWGYMNMDDGITPIDLSPRQRLDDVVRSMSEIPMGGTDCALPMLFARDQEREVDAFVLYTDYETWAGNVHPVQALRDYRAASGIADAALATVAMVPKEFAFSDGTDARVMDMVGFDTAAPQAISDFVSGTL